MKNSSEEVSPSMSLYLDLFRVLAAVCVVLKHGTWSLFCGGASHHYFFGHEAVIIFFVLSGFVISYVYSTREKTAPLFFLKRFSRLYSVLIPAVALTLILDYVGRKINPNFYTVSFNAHHPFIQVVDNIFFMAENWRHDVWLGTNGAIWSLDYEFWYYVIFGAFMFAPNSRARVVFLGAIGLFVGPKILLLLPCWLFGVAAHRLSKRAIPFANGGAAVSLLVLVLWFVLRPLRAVSFSELYGFKLAYSSCFIDDTFLAAFFSMHLIFASEFFKKKPELAFPSWITSSIKLMAGISFTLYLCHLSVERFFAVCLGLPSSKLVFLFFLVLTFSLCIGLGLLIEKRNKDLFLYMKKMFIRT